jgi:hypothetical protein
MVRNAQVPLGLRSQTEASRFRADLGATAWCSQISGPAPLSSCIGSVSER